ncbi:triose-phosphate isomerase [Apilactobacillus timberlakei]|nr:triose-phosphate isomerase [Apilactobacillus timberlakei]
MNFKSKMDVTEQKNMMDDIEKYDFQHRLLVAPSLLEKNDRKNFEIISQNLSIKDRTVGEISPNALKYLGIKYSIIGHLERRISLNESYYLIQYC